MLTQKNLNNNLNHFRFKTPIIKLIENENLKYLIENIVTLFWKIRSSNI